MGIKIIAGLFLAILVLPVRAAAPAAAAAGVVVSMPKQSPSSWFDCLLNIFRKDETPLHAAIAKNEAKTVEHLLKQGASAQACNKKGEPPLYSACRQWALAVGDPAPVGKGYEQLPGIIQALIVHGADLEVPIKRDTETRKLGTYMVSLGFQVFPCHDPEKAQLISLLHPMSAILAKSLESKNSHLNTQKDAQVKEVCAAIEGMPKDLVLLTATYNYHLNGYEEDLLQDALRMSRVHQKPTPIAAVARPEKVINFA